jgi:3-oxoacyl-[acyl-carrier-protein] synthase-3
VSVTRSVVLGIGLSARHILTNAELAKKVETSDSGSSAHRHPRAAHRGAGQTTSSSPSRRRAPPSAAHVEAPSIDLIVVATATPTPAPASAVSVQAGLGITQGRRSTCRRCAPASSVRSTVDALLKAGASAGAGDRRRTFSRILGWNDRGTCVLFGDSADAVILERSSCPAPRGPRHPGVAPACRRPLRDKLYVDGGPSRPRRSVPAHEGKDVFKHAVAMITRRDQDSFVETGYSAADIDWSCRTRPTSGSSTPPPSSSASRPRRW